LRKIELPSEDLAEQLQRHLKEKSFTGAVYEKGHKTIQFPDDLDPSQWSSLKTTVEKWGKGRHLEVVESLRLQATKPEAPQTKADPKVLEAEVKKKLDRLTPQSAEERYKYLLSRPISELTDSEFEERLALVQRSADKGKDQKK
jgi:hypothetical protein